MPETSLFSRLSIRLTAAFLLASVLGVILVAVLAYRSTSSEFNSFMGHVGIMEQMMGGGMMGGILPGGQTLAQAAGDFLNNLGRTLWLAGLAGVALAIILGYAFTRLIVSPLEQVANAAGRVARGDLEQKVTIRGSSELARLGESFNEMAETLNRDRKLRQNMVADIAHELRTPLTVLQGNIEAMQDGVLKPSPENLDSIHQETLLLTRLVEDLRTLSLADSGQLKFSPVDTDLKALALKLFDGFKNQLTARNIVPLFEASADLPVVRADPDRISQVLRNLLTNALHFTGDGGRIALRLSKDNGGVSVSVIDSGIGIPAADLPSVFDRFYRVDRSRARATGGSGLGLAIVKQLIEAQGGRVWADSAEGRGSSFSFWLPESAV